MFSNIVTTGVLPNVSMVEIQDRGAHFEDIFRILDVIKTGVIFRCSYVIPEDTTCWYLFFYIACWCTT